MEHTMKPKTEHLLAITASDDQIKSALNEADTASLMLALVHLTGDMDVIRGEARPIVAFLETGDGLTDAERESIRELAYRKITEYRDSPGELFTPNREQLLEMLQFLTGVEMSDQYVDFLTSELSMNGEDPYAQPAIFEVPEARRGAFEVLVIGAGMSGLLSAIRLQEAGIRFRVVEKNADVGGTWLENTYPGCRVDSANHTYSYSFRPQDWPQHFSGQEVLRDYFGETAKEYALREHIDFETEVTEARFDETTGRWNVSLLKNGTESSISVNAIISAVGQLNRPNMPDIDGVQDYQGISFHSARWQHQHDYSGLRIGVIGTGGSAFQFAPLLAEDAASVTLFQRTAPWIVPNQDYFEKVPDGKHWLLGHVPFYAKWFRFKMFWRSAEGLLDAVTADEGWNRPEESVGEANQAFRDLLIANLQAELAGRDDLLEKCTPDYPPGAKRALIDNGRYLRSLKRDNVSLITEPIERVTKKGVLTTDGVEHEFDVLIYGTGFKASSFLYPMKIYGKNGLELQEKWDGDPQAFKGVTVPDYPNLFLCYGPNTNIVVNGSIIFFSECEVRYILGCLALLMKEEGNYLDVRQEACDAYNAWINDGNAQMSWGQSSVNTWYKNARGKITQNWPFTLLEFWLQTREADPSDYEVVSR